ncbi:hypothetical protein EJ071_27705 [Mesorhizobium sp. M1B.F.Ca.ET.045.04.1.1]|nr:hypothetical protein EJ071_27705 [Mesorhizobium sp. M1B.F.Ca.ET.045.04.1.1]
METCPDFTVAEIEDLDPGIDEQTDAPAAAHDGIWLQPNGLITEDQITQFRNRCRMRTIVLIGEQRAGKTTLLSAIYGLLCKGPLGGHSFVSSRTLRAFAERNHLALVSSKRDVPTTPRTSRADPLGFFHLRLKAGDEVSDVVISDRSGEAFEAARTNTSLVDRLTELALADRICFLLDAARLTKLETRATYRRTFKQLIRALLDNNAVPSATKIEILITKLDRISGKKDGRDLEAEITAYEQELGQEFGKGSHDFSIYKVCALPRANVDLGFIGLAEMIDRWATPDGYVDINPPPVTRPLRQIDHLVKIWS